MERDEEALAQWVERDWPRIKRRAARTGAHIVFIDETGFLLHPLFRRTWAPRGQTPVLRHRMRHRRRVWAIGGLSISPQRRRLGWYLRFHVDASIRRAGFDRLKELAAAQGLQVHVCGCKNPDVSSDRCHLLPILSV